MFSPFVSSIKIGQFPDSIDLRRRFDLSLIKKMGVLRLPYHFWQRDPKINPSSEHMLWAAIFLEDHDGILAVKECIRIEEDESRKYKKGAEAGKGDVACEKIIKAFIDTFVHHVPAGDLKKSIVQKCIKAKKFCLSDTFV